MVRVLCVGAAVVDFIFNLEDLPRTARKYSTGSATVVGGGCAATAAVAVSRLGGEAILGARLGDDAVGDMILSDLRQEGVDVANVTRTAGGRSSYSSVYIDRFGERQIVNFRGEGLVLETRWFQALEGLNAVLADTRRTTAAIEAMKLAKARGIPAIVDGEAPVDPAILASASHAAFSMQGLTSLEPDLAPQTALSKVAAEHQCWACVTDGHNGVWYTDGDTVSHVPAPKIDAVDTLGAGDVWHGAFAFALAEGQAERQAVVFASAAAALKCTKPGGRAGAPTRAELEDFLKETTE